MLPIFMAGSAIISAGLATILYFKIAGKLETASILIQVSLCPLVGHNFGPQHKREDFNLIAALRSVCLFIGNQDDRKEKGH